ncbi:uncharacterized protein FIBRA_00825 [Fibroporia radiculosa]|uniref:Uncharacterized protein n=1 Tax=Fibroporia radiculosa TaxID=599839 RepID=J4GIP7_9APHY|nr:uncharacterized protein FIBRA_00825 [Fibroporia radiculosa]CCL98820.1 predicted protein [Fibroporia radiculosa]
MNNLHDHDVYAEELFKRGQGYPLWCPELGRNNNEIMIGDVGIVDKGSFRPLFNATLEKDHPINRKGVPQDFQIFNPSAGLDPVPVTEAIPSGPFHSGPFRVIQQPSDNAGAYRFECTGDRGAILILGSPAVREELPQVRRMKNYMSKHMQNWIEFAHDRGPEVQPEHIYFVRGWVKTTQWAVAALMQQANGAVLHFNGHFGSERAFTLENCASWGCRSGPKGRIFTSSGAADQCIFLHYFKLKKRRFVPLWKLEAAAEPRDPSPSSDDDIEQVPVPSYSHDPVDYVLDYILQHSEAQTAIASDKDIIDLCEGREPSEYPIPDDIPAFLESLQPAIEINAEGLGMLTLDEAAIDPPSGSTEGQSQQTGAENAPQGDERGNEEGSSSGPKRFLLSDTLLQLQANEFRGGVCALAYSFQGDYIAGGFEDSTIFVWSAADRHQLYELHGHTQAICSLAFSPTHMELASGSRDNMIIIWDPVMGTEIKRLEGHEGFVNCVTYSPDGKTLASASVDFTVRLWKLETGEEIASSDEHEAMVMMVAYSHDGSRLVTASADCVARLWNADTLTPIAVLDSHEAVIYSIAFSPDNKRLVTSSDDGTVRVWSAINGDEFMSLGEHTGSVWAAAFSADGRYVMSVASEGVVKICDVFGGELVDTIEGSDGLVNAATFSTDGKLVAAGGGDHTVRVWNTETKECVATFGGHSDNVTRLRFSPDAKKVVSASDDGTVRVYTIGQHYVAAPV